MFGKLIILQLKVIFLRDFSILKCFMFGKYYGFVSKARVSACMYFLVMMIIIARMMI
jgi:hypothetical protein